MKIIHKMMPTIGKRAATMPHTKHAGSAASVPRMRHRRMLFFPSANSKADHPRLFSPKSVDYKDLTPFTATSCRRLGEP